MTYIELKYLFHEYRMARLSRAGLEAAIGLWQRAEYGKVAELNSFLRRALWRRRAGVDELSDVW